MSSLEGVTVLLTESFRAPKHRKLSHRIRKDRSEPWRIQSGAWVGNIPFKVRVKMICQLLPAHQIFEQRSPRDLRKPFQVRHTMSIKELSEASHPRRWYKEAQGSISVDVPCRRRAFSMRGCNASLDFLVEAIARESSHNTHVYTY